MSPDRLSRVLAATRRYETAQAAWVAASEHFQRVQAARCCATAEEQRLALERLRDAWVEYLDAVDARDDLAVEAA